MGHLCPTLAFQSQSAATVPLAFIRASINLKLNANTDEISLGRCIPLPGLRYCPRVPLSEDPANPTA